MAKLANASAGESNPVRMSASIAKSDTTSVDSFSEIKRAIAIMRIVRVRIISSVMLQIYLICDKG